HRRRAPSLQPHGSTPWSANRRTWRQLQPRMRPTSLASTRRRAVEAVAVDPGVRVEVVTLYPSEVRCGQAHCLPRRKIIEGVWTVELVRAIGPQDLSRDAWISLEFSGLVWGRGLIRGLDSVLFPRPHPLGVPI